MSETRIERIGSGLLTRNDVLAAAERIRGRVHRTPTLTSRTLGEDVVLKAELFQKTGSFKVRGVLNKLASLSADEKAVGVIGISAGNHAQALAWGAAAEGIDCLVVMWASASEAKVDATRGYGARVDLEAVDPAAAFERLAVLIAETGRTLVHPFDDPVVLAGAGTVALELLEDAPETETILVPTGGGGLVAGIAAAAPDRRVVAVEPERSTAVHSGLAAGRSVPVKPDSIADGLSAPFAGEQALALLREHEVESVLVSEAEIETAFRFLYARAKLACEPAAALGAAAILAGKVTGSGLAFVVSGGNVVAETASAILASR
ncbi:MAG: pyridoxal-phosphate dependent enzyme [Gaiellaceae bacterium MAG52_C11]|nr:pyridoxal-phosphate dependent enzyme [Candidatus Gaiellasilicea maunaloa]